MTARQSNGLIHFCRTCLISYKTEYNFNIELFKRIKFHKSKDSSICAKIPAYYPDDIIVIKRFVIVLLQNRFLNSLYIYLIW
ncbi:MAG: hypothetical protein JWR38_730 [Mucilaginibacter sp.]|nr:hypothetical protein [Mucilaginibacter sp.]